METRVIIEVINEYTFVLDKQFENLDSLPNPILDFKFIRVEGQRGTT